MASACSEKTSRSFPSWMYAAGIRISNWTSAGVQSLALIFWSTCRRLFSTLRAEIYQRPATRFVAEFVGSPAMNYLPARWRGDVLQAHGQELAITPGQRKALQAGAGDELHLGVRPEDLRLADAGVPGRLTVVEPTDPETCATAETALGRLTVRAPGTPSLASGQAVRLTWAAEQQHLFSAVGGRRIS